MIFAAILLTSSQNFLKAKDHFSDAMVGKQKDQSVGMAEVPIDQEKMVDGEEKLADEDESKADSFLSH